MTNTELEQLAEETAVKWLDKKSPYQLEFLKPIILSALQEVNDQQEKDHQTLIQLGCEDRLVLLNQITDLTQKLEKAKKKLEQIKFQLECDLLPNTDADILSHIKEIIEE